MKADNFNENMRMASGNVEYNNGWLAQYAEYCAEKLLKAGDKLKKG